MDPKLLQLLIDRAREVRDVAATRAATSRRDRAAAEATLRTLTEYRVESLAKGPVRTGNAIGVQQLVTAVHFDGRLLSAIDAQAQQHADRLATSERHDAELIARQKRLKALELLSQRRALARARTATRREQHGFDELAANRAARKQPGKD
jgi:flagellar FliJ protein